MIYQNSWNDKTTVQKGNYGEKLVKQYLESKGWIVYGVETEGRHAFDKLCVKDKKHIIIAEIKTKARMNYYPATGFNTRNYNEYKFLQNKYGIDIFIFFVDEALHKIYGNKLKELERNKIIKNKSYPMEIKDITLFPLINMIEIADLKQEDSNYLINHSTRNYEYNFER